MNKYSITIFWSDEDDSYIAVIPEFPGVSAFGKSPEDAIAEVRVALQLYMDSYDDEALPLRKPHSRHLHSGEIGVRLPMGLLRVASLLAFGEGISLKSFIVTAVAEKIRGQRITPRITEKMREV